jgi:glycerol transport system ATP-binding protein
VVQQEGVHTLKIGEPVTAYVNARRLFAFGADGGLVAAPPRPRLGMAAE